MGIKRCSATDSEFSDKNWKRRGIKNLPRKVHETGLLDPTGSGRPHTSRSCVVQPGWWYSWIMASTLASLCLSRRRTFWTYVVTISLFYCTWWTLFRTMLDAAGVVLRVLITVWNVMFYFHKVAYLQYLAELDIFLYISKKISSSLQQCKNYKNRSRFSKVMITNALPPFYGSQCTMLLGDEDTYVDLAIVFAL